MALSCTVRPISDRTQFTGPPLSGDRTPFDSPWSKTLRLLEFELGKIDAHNVVMEIDVQEHELRLDGTLRANASPAGPGVRIAFDSKYGPLIYGSDRYGWTYDGRYYRDGWQQNVRAIALGLEALRKVERYGITKRGEQYTGWKALPPGTGLAPTGMTVEIALKVLAEETNGNTADTAAGLAVLLRNAKANAHPDRNNGDRSRWNAVDEAEQVLRRAGRLA